MDGATPQASYQNEYVGSPARKSSSRTLWFIVIVLGIIALVVVGFIIFGRNQQKETTPKPTETSAVKIEFIEPSTSVVASASASKAELTIEVLNGTGIAKEASFLESKLQELGYEKIEAGNANTKDYDVAQVTFYSSFPSTFRDELMSMLKKSYTDVKSTDAKGESTVDVRIITGLRPGISRPSATPKSTESSTASPTASSSAMLRVAPSLF